MKHQMETYVLKSSRKNQIDDLDKKKKVTPKKGRKTLASKMECYDKISVMKKVSVLKHKRKLEFLVNNIKNKKFKK